VDGQSAISPSLGGNTIVGKRGGPATLWQEIHISGEFWDEVRPIQSFLFTWNFLAARFQKITLFIAKDYVVVLLLIPVG